MEMRHLVKLFELIPVSTSIMQKTRETLGIKSKLVFLFLLFVLDFTVGDVTTETVDWEEKFFPTEECEAVLVNCKCYDYDEVVGIVCANVSDFGIFSRTLADGSLFEFNTTYEITVQGIKSIPRGAFRDLIVFRLFMDDPQIENIEEGVFEGVYRFRWFRVRLSSLKKLPDFRNIRDSFRNLNFDNSLLTSLEGDGLKDLYLLKTISFVNNSIRYLAPDVFQGTENVIIFDVSFNELSFLPPNLFDPWTDIMKVVLSHNRLLHVDQLFAISHPQFIFLDYNNLTDVDSILYPNMHRVETVQLSYNPIENITKDSFNYKINNTRFLYLDHCLIREFDVRHYDQLGILSTLDLSYNLIEEVTDQTIEFASKIELDFTGNHIREFNAELGFTVKRVYLNKNLLTSLGRTIRFSQMSEVSMADNLIEALTSEDFHGVHSVRVLDLQGNLIRTVEQGTFENIRRDVIYLDLSRNLLQSLNGCVQRLSMLASLNLTDNRIRAFEDGEFMGLNELTELYLHGNQLVTLSSHLQNLPQLQYLVISHNRIRTLKKGQLPPNLKYLYLAGNPFTCDCGLYPLLQYLNNSESPGTDVSLCTSLNVSTQWSVVRCPEPCSCSCTNFGSDHFISVDCGSRNLPQLPPLFQIQNFTTDSQNSPTLVLEIERTQNPDVIYAKHGPFTVEDVIGSLNLSNISMASLERVKLPETLRHLYLHHNLLRDPLPIAKLYELTNLTRVTLACNPWRCDCEMVSFKKWILSNTEIVLDVNDTRCGPPDSEGPDLIDRLIWTLSDLDLCPADIGFYISLAFGLLVTCLLAASAKILWTKYELNVKVWLYSHGVTWVKERDIDRDKTFDAFISFSHKDENFVIEKFLSVIENKEPNIRLCVHYKHFLAGEFIHDNILNAVQNSKRTVLILSRNFLESEWCLMEFRAAHVQALKDKVHRIVVIKLGELPKQIDPAIQVYLDSTTYLTWGDKYFWNNLFFILPTCDRSKKFGPNKNGSCKPYPQIAMSEEVHSSF